MYAWAVERVKDRDRFIADLHDPIPGDEYHVIDQRTIDAENAALMQFASEAGRL